MASEKHSRLVKLRKSSLVQDNSGPHRVYRDSEGNIYHSVTHVIKETAPPQQKEALERWMQRPSSGEDRNMAATRGTLAHSHAEHVLKTAVKLARQTANKRNCWKTSPDGLERCPGSITRWGIERAIQGAPKVPWSAAGYARGLRRYIADNVTAIHAIEFSIHHPLGHAGTCDALVDLNGKGPFIVDWKTSVKERSEEMCTNYIDQLGAYSLGLRHLTGIEPVGGVIVIARRTGEPQLRTLSQLELRGAEMRFSERVQAYTEALLNEAG